MNFNNRFSFYEALDRHHYCLIYHILAFSKGINGKKAFVFLSYSKKTGHFF